MEPPYGPQHQASGNGASGRKLAKRTGETITATRRAIEERLKRMGSQARKAALLEHMEAMQRRLSTLPVLDHRSPDEIIGYDESGVPN